MDFHVFIYSDKFIHILKLDSGKYPYMKELCVLEAMLLLQYDDVL